MIRDDIKKALLDDYVIEVLICLIITALLVYQFLFKPESPMMKAVVNNDLVAAEQLIDKSESLDEFGPCRETRSLFTTPLIEAVKLGRREIAAELLKAGADVNARDEFGTTPLLAALTRGDIETARTLLANRADPNLPTCIGHGSCTTALACARRLQDPQLVARIESLGGSEDPGFFFSVECLWTDMKPMLLLVLTRIAPFVCLVVLSGSLLRRRLRSKQFQGRKTSIDYEESLTALLWLLETVGESHWSQWVREDLDLWRSSRQVKHHLSAYGGMGSLNDVWICAANGHPVSRESEPWAQETFEALKAICYALARMPHRRIGCRAVRLLLRTESPPLLGWRCLECGYQEITPKELESYVAKQVTPVAIANACRNGNLRGFVSAALAGVVPGADTERKRVTDLLSKSGIVLRPREGWLRPCTKCSGTSTAVYRWRERLTIRGKRFVPARDNRPLERPNT